MSSGICTEEEFSLRKYPPIFCYFHFGKGAVMVEEKRYHLSFTSGLPNVGSEEEG